MRAATIVPSTLRTYWILFLFAALSFLTTLPIQYVGEEAVYPLMSYEMSFHGKYLIPVMYGENYWRPPLYNLMIIPVANGIGWDYMLIAARLVTLTATLMSALLLAWFVRRLTADKIFAVFTALVYLTLGDVLFYGGWLCYADPVFSLFVLASIVLGWTSLAEKRYSYLAGAVLALTAAFLTKVLTAYIFYGTAMLIIAYRNRRLSFLYSWRSIFLHGLALMIPALWYHSMPSTGSSYNIFTDITSKLHPESWQQYFTQVFTFPLQTLEQLLPIAGMLLYAYWRKQALGKWREHPAMVTVLLIVSVNYLPYWLAPQSGIRYLMPLYPLAAVILGYMSFHGAPKVRGWAVNWLIAAIVLKFIFGFWVGPYLYNERKGSFETVARDIVSITGQHNLYALDSAASGISTVAYIDRMIFPKAPLISPPAQFDNGFVISYTLNQNLGMLYKKYYIAGDDIYLLCRGTACLNSRSTVAESRKP